jgi:anionic cell wall polymer biosynthesis LytR-Cps2A-Psr (LCP) family protein
LGVPIDRYASVNLPGFKSVIEAVGSITVNNPSPINDRKNNFYLTAGEHRLDADAALLYVRSRYGPANNDFVRARRQQQVLGALRKELLRTDRIVELPGRIDAISRVLNTDFPPSQLNEVMRLADIVSSEPTGSWVFSSPRWAVHPPMSETGGRWVIRLKLDLIAQLSRELFGSKSLYSR